MFAVNDSSVDTLVKLYAPNGSLVGQDDDGAQVGSNSFLVAQLPSTGTYTLVASRYSGSGDYRLRVEKGAKAGLGDLNRDCRIDSRDIVIMNDALGGRDANADLNMDGVVDASDGRIQFLRLGRGCMAPAH